MSLTTVYRNAAERFYHAYRLRHATGGLNPRNHVAVCTQTARNYTTSTYSSSSNTAGGNYYNQTKEDEEDKVLEDEEFAALRDGDDDEFMPIAHRLAHKADALDAELRRLRYVLCERPQFLVDTYPSTLSGRPTQMKKVLELLREQQKDPSTAASAPANAEKGESALQNRSSNRPVTSSSLSSLSAKMEAALRASPYSSWTGTSAPVIRLLSLRFFWPHSRASSAVAAASAHNTELATTDADLDYLRRARALHQLNYYSRLNLTPKRHIFLALYQIVWNFLIAAQNACGCIIYGAMRGVKEHGILKGLCTGVTTGLVKGVAFLGYGFILSPALHLPRGLCNSFYGPLNALTGKYMFDAISGRWMRCTVADTCLFRHELQREKRVLRTIGRAEFRRKNMKIEHKWSNRMASMGFSVDVLAEKFMSGKKASRGDSGNCSGNASPRPEDKIRNPYEVLQVRHTASTQEIKKQYKKLAMVFHPDVAQSRQDGNLSAEEKVIAQRKFEEIASAYQILSNPEKRKAYDMGGAQGVHLYETKYGKFMSRTPEEIVQSIFGGEGFRRMLIGELLRSHWALRYEAQVSVSIHELEELQCIRVRQVAMELAAITDVHARRPTSPYYGGSISSGVGVSSTAVRGNGSSMHAAGTTAAGDGSHRRSAFSHGGLSSNLPDYLKSRKTKNTRSASPLGELRGAGATCNAAVVGKGIEKDLHNSIMEELGAGHTDASSSSLSSFGGQESRSGAGANTSSSTTRAEADLLAASPFILRPGSNEYNCFSRDFEYRCDKFVRHLADACFGKQLLYEVGEAYVVSAQRFLGIRPFYAPKILVTRKIFSGLDRVFEAFKDNVKMDKQQLSQKLVAEYFNMEYDAVVADIHVALRYALQMVLQDAVECEEVRRKRCYAVWLLGEKMITVGERWTSHITKDENLGAYIQQAANSAATTSKPPAF